MEQDIGAAVWLSEDCHVLSTAESAGSRVGCSSQPAARVAPLNTPHPYPTYAPVDVAVILSPLCTRPSSTSTRHTTPLQQAGRGRQAGGCGWAAREERRRGGRWFGGQARSRSQARRTRHAAQTRQPPELVMVGVKQQQAQVGCWIAAWGRHPRHHGRQHRLQTQPCGVVGMACGRGAWRVVHVMAARRAGVSTQVASRERWGGEFDQRQRR